MTGRVQQPGGKSWSATSTQFPGWKRQAACIGHPATLWSPKEVEFSNTVRVVWNQREVVQAKRICAGCPVQEQCLDWALRHRIGTDLWGGLLPRERERLNP
jgi:WhiB family redox-sensing transcriptional regulator